MFGIIKKITKTLLPKPLFIFVTNAYHFLFAYGSALFYGFPSRKLVVIAVTGTKGKSSVSEMVNAILEGAGYRTALANTIRFKINEISKPNLFKMTMPGRGYLQKFLRDARRADCTHVVLEITSEGARQFRNRGIALNALIFTNIAPEHIESHGSFEAYREAKLAIGQSLAASPKRPRTVVAHSDDELGKRFLTLKVEQAIPFSLQNAVPYETREKNISMTFDGVTFEVPFPGEFTVLNALAAATLAKALGIDAKKIGYALQHMPPIKGRAERIDCGQDFSVIVDYAHTPDSLKALYGAFPHSRKICVLGNTGGGRDTWKRPEMGRIADESCEEVILTNEDPYDEDPESILEEMKAGMKCPPKIILDRRRAIKEALLGAKKGDVVLITGKGTDPYIMEAHGTKTLWSDKAVTEEELIKLMQNKNSSDQKK